MNTNAPEIVYRSLRLPRPLDRQLRLLAAEHEQSIHATILDAITAAVQPHPNENDIDHA